jgi:hypothetical protein
MGTEIILNIGGINLTYSKNERGIDHGSLFQDKDRKRYRSEQIDYDFFDESDEELEKCEMAFVRSLRDILPRLELLGFTLDTAKLEYEQLLLEDTILEEESSEKIDYMTFEEFVQFVAQYPIADLDDKLVLDRGEEREEKIRGRFNNNSNIKRIPPISLYCEFDSYSEVSYFGNLINFLRPYSVLRILAENKDNLDIDVIWHYGLLVGNGWAKREEFISGAKRHEKFHIVTEGISDARILKHALFLLKPDVQDFFTFIDVKHNYPFSGVGNLVNFAKGLVAIDVHNNMVFLFDNDAVGYEAYKKCIEIKLPNNLCATILPELNQFHNFPIQEKDQNHISYGDINHSAAGIECYLDLKSVDGNPLVSMTSYVKNVDRSQGALRYKQKYEEKFLNQSKDSIASYDTKNIEAVLNVLISKCRDIKVVSCQFAL